MKMMPSEIAAELDGEAFNYNNPLFAQAAATIRELEGRVAHYEKAFANAQNADAEANGLLRSKLKIATEALEEIGSEQDMQDNRGKPLNVRIALDLTARIERATQALARIKEEG